MSSYKKLFIAVLLCAVCWLAAVSALLADCEKTESSKEYLVEINRIVLLLEKDENPDISDYSYVTEVSECTDAKMLEENGCFAVREINGRIYRFDYVQSKENNNIKLRILIAVFITEAMVIILLIYIYNAILKPFEKMTEVPYELSKGNLSPELTESKSRHFGKFVWGVNALRETIEQQRERELELHKDKQTILLSISHDIKTPLAAIKLYSKAVSTGLYSSEEKVKAAAESIGQNADSIEAFVSEIVRTSNDDFLVLDVNYGKVRFSDIIAKIKKYYSDKLSTLKTDFITAPFTDCTVNGDKERLNEVLQNIIENAIKYGGGHYIKLEFADEEDCRLVTVVNDGCTLPENEIPHLFDSFWRGSNRGSNKGNGLGLYICKKLMQKMNGEVFAEVVGDEMRVTVVMRKE